MVPLKPTDISVLTPFSWCPLRYLVGVSHLFPAGTLTDVIFAYSVWFSFSINKTLHC